MEKRRVFSRDYELAAVKKVVEQGLSYSREVPAKVNVFLGDIGKQLAESAARNKRSLGEEIRQRLKQSLLNDAKLIDDKSSETNEAR